MANTFKTAREAHHLATALCDELLLIADRYGGTYESVREFFRASFLAAARNSTASVGQLEMCDDVTHLASFHWEKRP